MSGFDAHWLSLRADADSRSRSGALAKRLSEWLASRAPRAHLVDLGCGTGANVRFLAARLGVEQRWTCVDDDLALLEHLASVRIAGVVLEPRREDLARGGLQRLSDIDAQVFCGSALLDLVSASWLDDLVALARGRGSAVLFALTYDGRLECQPPHAADDAMRAAFNAHQQRDKSFGVALGLQACEAVSTSLRGSGYEVYRERSDWQLRAHDADDAALLSPLLEGIVSAATEQVPADAARFEAWLAARLRQCAAGALELMVGHEDTLGLPPDNSPR